MDMEENLFAAEIKRILREQGFLKISLHALDEMADDALEVDDIIECILNGEMIEDYPEDTRGHSSLFLGWVRGAPIHAVCAIVNNHVFLITAWIPDPGVWMDDYRTRRKQV